MVQARKSCDDMGRKIGFGFHEGIRVDNGVDHLQHGVRLVGIGGDDAGQFFCVLVGSGWIGWICSRGLAHRRAVKVVRRQIGQQPAKSREGLAVAGKVPVRHAAYCRVGLGSPQIVEGNFFAGHSLNDIWARDEHVAGLIHHEHKIRYGR